MKKEDTLKVCISGSEKNYLLEARNRAKQLLKEKGLVSVVYAYTPKEKPFEIHVLDWKFLEFKTDKELSDYLKFAESAAVMIYAVYT